VEFCAKYELFHLSKEERAFMRTLFGILLAILVLPYSALSQSDYVVFQNNVLTPPPERRVLGVDFQPLVGTNYMAQLLIGPSPDSLVPTTAAPARFRDPGTSLPGTWSGYNIALPGFAPGSELYMQVRVWDSNFGLTFEQACAVAPGQAGLLPVFTWTVPGQAAPPQDHYMLGFVGGIPAPCPEPGVIGMFCLALPVLLIWGKRRTRRS
jgi:hypothetical protein